MGIIKDIQGEGIVFIPGKLCQILTVYFKVMISKKLIFSE